jgi:hypothetical protein
VAILLALYAQSVYKKGNLLSRQRQCKPNSQATGVFHYRHPYCRRKERALILDLHDGVQTAAWLNPQAVNDNIVLGTKLHIC